MNKLTLLLADDHELVRHGLRSVLAQEADWTICGEAATGRQAVELARQLHPDIAILDLAMPELNGLEATRQIRAALPDTEVLILTMHSSEELMRETLASGARGFVLKSDAGRSLVAAIRALARHKPFVSPQVTDIGVDRLIAPHAPPSPADLDPLTPREREVVQLVAEGKCSKELADLLGIAVKTVETHRSNIMRKLGLRSVSDVVRYAIRNRIIQP